MEPSVLAGVAVVVLAGLVMGTSPWPIKLMHTFKFEHFAFIAMLVGLLIMPWAITLRFCPDALTALAEVDRAVLLKANLLSMSWGCEWLAETSHSDPRLHAATATQLLVFL